MKIKQGDPVRVRLATGEAVDAVYDRPSSLLDKCHIVSIGVFPYIAIGGWYACKGVSLKYECRFVGPTPIPVKAGEQK